MRVENGEYGGADLVCVATHGHGNCRVMVFEAREEIPPDFAGTEMAIVEFVSEIKVDP